MISRFAGNTSVSYSIDIVSEWMVTVFVPMGMEGVPWGMYETQ
jgi:hypothetical protein